MQKARKQRHNKQSSKTNHQQFSKDGPQPPSSSSSANSAHVPAPPTSNFHDEVELMNFKHLLAGRFAQNQDLLEILLERSMPIQNIIAPDCYPSAKFYDPSSPFNIWIGNLEKVKELAEKNERQMVADKQKTQLVDANFLKVTELIHDFDKDIRSIDEVSESLTDFKKKYSNLKKQGDHSKSIRPYVAEGRFIKKSSNKLKPATFSKAPENWAILKVQIEEQIAKKKREEEEERLKKIQEEKERLERERKQKEEEHQRKKKQQEELLLKQKQEEELRKAEEEKHRKLLEEQQKHFLQQQQQQQPLVPMQMPGSMPVVPDIMLSPHQVVNQQQPQVQQVAAGASSQHSSHPHQQQQQQPMFNGLPDSEEPNFDNMMMSQPTETNFLTNNDSEFSLDPTNTGDLNDLGGFMHTDNFGMYSTLDDNDFLNQIDHSMD